LVPGNQVLAIGLPWSLVVLDPPSVLPPSIVAGVFSGKGSFAESATRLLFTLALA
jgi:hypothetical protein